MLRLGIVGIGGISQKAYLPYMRQLPDIEWHIYTRNEAVVQQVSGLFREVINYDSLADMLNSRLDGVFIHAATVVHIEIAEQFLRRGIPVYMDKPLAEDFDQVAGLYQLAAEKGTFLMAGFNRRFAPKVLTLAEQTDKRRIVAEKNDINRPGDLQFKTFDVFIHPLDTALFLADGKLISGQFSYHKDGDLLSQVSVNLYTEKETVVATMNLQSGSRREIMEVQTPQATYQLKNLDDLTIFEGNRETKDAFGSWDTTLYKRGFETAILSFLEAIKTGINPVSPESSLLSHWICHQIVQSDQPQGNLDVQLPQKG